VRATPPYCSESVFMNRSDMSSVNIQNTQGEPLWQQFTTVVILRENIRQKLLNSEDADYRKALEKMDYKACTNEDIMLLDSLISKSPEGTKNFENDMYHNVLIIKDLLRSLS